MNNICELLKKIKMLENEGLKLEYTANRKLQVKNKLKIYLTSDKPNEIISFADGFLAAKYFYKP